MPLKIDTSKMSEEEKIEMQRLQQKRAKKLAKLNKQKEDAAQKKTCRTMGNRMYQT